jgi:hypothetical protein
MNGSTTPTSEKTTPIGASPTSSAGSSPDRGLKFKREPSKLVTDITNTLMKASSDASMETGISKASLPTSPFEITNLYFEEEELEGHPDHEHHAGGRVLDAVIRPYAAKIAGTPLTSSFNMEKTSFAFAFTTPKNAVRFHHDNASVSSV